MIWAQPTTFKQTFCEFMINAKIMSKDTAVQTIYTTRKGNLQAWMSLSITYMANAKAFTHMKSSGCAVAYSWVVEPVEMAGYIIF